MAQVASRLVKDPDKKKDIIGWLNLADDDYLSARVLIDNGMLIQGAILSSTSIEKYLKMIGEIFDVKFSSRDIKEHNVLGLYQTHKNNGSTLNLNKNYLKFLVKIYRYRYPDNLESNFSFALNQSKLIVALDEAVHILRNRLKLVNEKGEEQQNSRIHEMVRSNDLRLTRMNHTFGNIAREELFNKPSVWHEVRFVDGKTWMEAQYTAFVKDDGEYNLSGMDQGESERQFKLKAEPIDLKISHSK